MPYCPCITHWYTPTYPTVQQSTPVLTTPPLKNSQKSKKKPFVSSAMLLTVPIPRPSSRIFKYYLLINCLHTANWNSCTASPSTTCPPLSMECGQKTLIVIQPTTWEMPITIIFPLPNSQLSRDYPYLPSHSSGTPNYTPKKKWIQKSIWGR